jgi:nucleotide-binding universal stress UspA family protein
MLEGVSDVLIGLTTEMGEDEASSALAYGLSLAKEAKAHVTIQAASLKIALTSAWVSGTFQSMVEEQNRRIRDLAQAIASHAAQDATTAGVEYTTQSPHLAYPDLLASFRRLGRLHDLTVLDAEPEALKVDRSLFESILFGTGRPVLVVPPAWESFRVRRVVVAWDGSATAARAAHDALPFLRAADLAEIVTVTGEKDLTGSADGEACAQHLARHQVNVAARTIPARGGDAAEALRQHAAETDADMLVMGAYVHSRLREMVFGGATQSLLQACPVPLFMSH